jgi:chromosome partitioning protein
VSDNSDDLAERGRAIFERLRSLNAADDPVPPTVQESDDEKPPAAEAPIAAAVPEPEDAADQVEATVGPVVEPVEDPGGGAVPTPPAAAATHEADDDLPDTGGVQQHPPDSRDDLAAPDADDTAPRPLPGAADLPTGEPGAEQAPAAAAFAAPTPVDAGPEPGAPALVDGTSAPAHSRPEGDDMALPDAPPEEPAAGFARPLPRILAIANQKGGVGKTTTAVNLGACLADLGYRVLVVDLDPQGNASTGLGINIRDLQGSMYDVMLHDLPIEDCVEATSVRNLFVAPSSLDLAGAEIELVPAFSREMRLRRALDEVRDDYDFVLIDCPPSLGLLTVNGLAAAGEVVVPIQCEYYALEGLGQLLRNVNLVQKNLNPDLELSAIVLVMHDGRTKLADQVVREVRAHFGDKVCRNVVPRTVRLSEAPSFGQPIIAFDASSRGAVAYRELAKEVSGGAPQRLG